MKFFLKNKEAANKLAAAGFEVEPGRKRFYWEPNWDYEWVQLSSQSGFFVHVDGESISGVKKELYKKYGVLISSGKDVYL